MHERLSAFEVTMEVVRCGFGSIQTGDGDATSILERVSADAVAVLVAMATLGHVP